MSGGIPAKLGLSFERDYVCLQWLRMLLGLVDEVTWEPLGDDEPGVDVMLREGSSWTAVQCKTRAAGEWSGNELAPIVEHGLHHLRRSQRVDTFKLVHNGIAAFPRWLRPWADRKGLSACAPESKRDRESKLGRIVATADPALLERCMQEPIAGHDLEQRLVDHAHALVTEPRRLLDALAALRDRDVLGQSLDAIRLKSSIDSTRFEWHHPSPLSVAQAAHHHTADFVASNSAQCPDPLPRPEPEVLLNLLTESAEGCVVLVHGAPGIGKSTVIAEAVAACQRQDLQVLAFSAVELETLQEQKLLPQQLAIAWNVERPRILFIDQVDQVASALAARTAPWRDIKAYIQSALERRMAIVLGVRTIDALHSAYLRELAARLGEWTDYDSTAPASQSSGGVHPVARNVRLRVQPLVEPVVAQRLEAQHIAYAALPPKTRELLRNPLALSLFVDLVDKAGWRAADSLHRLVDDWLSTILEPIPAGRDALDSILDVMARERVTRVRRIDFERLDAVEMLVKSGVLLDEGGWLRLLHQVVLDAYVASKLGGLRDVGTVIERIGPRDAQGVLAATQLRLAVARWSLRAPRFLDQLYRSPELRPFSRFGLLLGLADEPDAPPTELGEVLCGWLGDGLHTDWIARVVLHGRGAWVRSVRPWLERAWSPGGTDEGLVVELLASVSVAEGDLVTDILEAWAKRDPEVLQRARVLFLQSPAQDTDRLFELRLSDPDLFAALHTHVDWRALAESHPERAARCFARLMAKQPIEQWFGDRDTANRRRPRQADLQRISEARPGLLWQSMRALWLTLPPYPSGDLHFKLSERHRPLIGFVVEALGGDLACALDRGTLDWGALEAALPTPLRTIDRWLLVEVASAVETQPAADRAWQWIEAQLVRRPYWTELDAWTQRRELAIGDIDRFGSVTLARRVARHLATRAALAQRTRIEAWGAELGGDAETADIRAGFGPVASGFDADELRGWSQARWIEELHRVSQVSRTLEHSSRGWTSRDIHSLSRELCDLVEADPSAALGLAHSILDAQPPIDERVLPYLVERLCGQDPPQRFAESTSWLPLSDEAVEMIVGHERVLFSERCAVDFARIVSTRPAHPWPERVIDRLVQLASSCENPHELSRALFDAPSAVALEALANIVRHHARYRQRALEVAADVCRSGPNHSRLAAVKLAATLVIHLGGPAAEVVLEGCSELAVAAHRDGLHAILYTFDQCRSDPAFRQGVVRLVERLHASSSAEQQRAAGRCATALRWRDAVTDEQLACFLRPHCALRLGATDVLRQAIQRPLVERWMLELALTLADDAHEAVVRAVMSALAPDLRAPLELPEPWIERLTRTRAMVLHPDEVFDLIARQGAPVAVADLVVRGAQRFLDEHQAPSQRTGWAWPFHSAAETWCSRLAQLIEAESKTPSEQSAVSSAALGLWERLLAEFPQHTVARSHGFVG